MTNGCRQSGRRSEMHFLTRILAAGALIGALSGVGLWGQSPSAGSVTGVCHVSPIVANLDRSARFYHNILGLDLVPAPPAGSLPWDTDPGHIELLDCPRRGCGLSAPYARRALWDRTGAVRSSRSQNRAAADERSGIGNVDCARSRS